MPSLSVQHEGGYTGLADAHTTWHVQLVLCGWLTGNRLRPIGL